MRRISAALIHESRREAHRSLARRLPELWLAAELKRPSTCSRGPSFAALHCGTNSALGTRAH